MSYPVGLDELSDDALRKELRRRAEARSKGLCDYCNRARGTVACRFPGRHHGTDDIALSIDEMWVELAKHAHNLDVRATYNIHGQSLDASVSWNYGQGCRRLQANETTLSAAVKAAYDMHTARRKVFK